MYLRRAATSRAATSRAATSRTAAALMVMAFSAVMAVAQTNTGGISGNVTDKTGAVVPNAQVVITNTGTNETRRLTTNGKGSFIQEDLSPAVYRIEVIAPGFGKSQVDNIKVDTGTVATANVELTPGNVSTQVSVSANASLVNTESGTLGQTITGRQLEDLPLPNRSVLDLAVTLPNMSGDVGTEDPQVTSGAPVPGFNLNTNGGRAGGTYMMADGVSNTGVGLAREVVAFSPETVQEFTVQTNGFDAQYGRTGGGIVNVTTKSGTNEYHGGVFWYSRNPFLNADPYTIATVNRPVENLRWNQFDGQLGGPVIIPKVYNGKNKTFFFFAGEPRYQSDHLQSTANLPTSQMLSGNFSNLVLENGGSTSGGAGPAPASLLSQFPSSAFASTNTINIYDQFNVSGNQFKTAALPASGSYAQFPGNIIPASMIDPTAVNLLKYLPKPNTTPFLDTNGYVDNFEAYRFVSDNETRYNLRIDQNISDRNHLSFRWTTVPEIGITGFDAQYPIDGVGATYSDSHQFMLSDTWTISPTIVNELRLAYTRANFSGALPPQYDINSGQNISTENGLPSLTKGGVPLLSFELDSFGAIGSQGSTQNTNLEQQYEIADNVYITRGAMTLKFGVDLSRDMLNAENFYAADGGNYSFRYVQTDSTGGAGTQTNIGGFGLASYLLGVPNQVSLATSLIPYYYRWNSGAGFVQNDWKVRPNLTLNLGMRYSLQLPRTEEYNHQGFFDPALAETVNLPTPCQLPNCTAAGAATGLPVITQATIVPFAFDGYGGRSRYLTPIRWLDFEPRFGFAYQPKTDGFWNWIVRGGYGLSHVPLTGLNRQPVPNFAGGTASFGENAGQVNSNYVMRLSSNPPYDPFVPTNNVLDLANNPSGLVYGPAINFPGYVESGETAVPYVQNWNFSLQKQFGPRTVVELSYAGSKGTHLFMPQVDVNNAPLSYLSFLQNNNYTASNTVTDPLGRKNANGTTITDTLQSLAAPYFGFGPVDTLYDASGNSSFHAAIVSVRQQAMKGLQFYTNFRWSKSIDDASDASPDKSTLTAGTPAGGQYAYGAPASGDRSVSTYNQPYVFNFVSIYDLPYGKGRPWGQNAWAPMQFLFGGWTLSGVERYYSGFPAEVTIATDSYVNTVVTHGIRPNIVSGVPYINPNFNMNCPTSASCAPYINPALFELPPAGTLGNAPRTLPWIDGPMIQQFDASIQKTFTIKDKYRVQFRLDGINVFNHPTFRNAVNSAGGTDFFGNYPSFTPTAANIESTYNAWASYNGQPLYGTPTGNANVAAMQAFIKGAENSAGTLPANYFTVPLPSNITSANANAYNVLTPAGYKLNQVRNNLDLGMGGSLYYPGQPIASPRYLQFAVKIIF